MAGHLYDVDTLALWRFDDLVGTALADTTGAYPGTASQGNPEVLADGQVGMARRFGWTEPIQRVTCATDSTFRNVVAGTEWTVEGWMRFPNGMPSGFTGILGLGNPTTGKWLFDLHAWDVTGLFQVGCSLAGRGPIGTAIPTVNWFHWAITKESAGPNVLYTLYVNGVLNGTYAGSGTNEPPDSGMVVAFGQSTIGYGYVELDDTRWSDVVRSPEEILSSYSRGLVEEMANEPLLAWDTRVLVAEESAWATPPNPAGSQALETINCDMGPAGEVGNTRPQKDKTLGRGMTAKFVEGRKDPIPFSIETSVKSRAAVDTAPKERSLYRAGGLVETFNSGTSVVYGFSTSPTDIPLSVYRTMGGPGTVPGYAEQGFGGVVKSLTWSGGDQELTLKAAGAFAGKYNLGQATATLADGSGTSLTLTGDDIYRVGPGWYLLESEIIKVTDWPNTSTGVTPILRAQLSSTGAAHSAVAMTPYVPTLTMAGSPISEANASVTLDSLALRCTKFSVELTTGRDHLPAETGSSRVQGSKTVRYDIKTSLSLALKVEQAALLGKVKQRKLVPLVIVAGTGVGSIVTFSMPYSEVVPFVVPDSPNDIVMIDLELRHRDNSGNDMMSVTMT